MLKKKKIPKNLEKNKKDFKINKQFWMQLEPKGLMKTLKEKQEKRKKRKFY